MNVKNYLRQVYWLDKVINSELKELEVLKSMKETVQGLSYGERIGSSGNRNIEAPFVKTIEKIMLLEDRIDQEVDRLVDVKDAIEEKLRQMPDMRERLVLKHRYIDNMDWEEIAKELCVSYRTVHRIHSDALIHFPMEKIKVGS